MRDSARHRPSSLFWLRSRRRSSEPQVLVVHGDMTSSDRVHELFNRFRRSMRRGVRHIIIDLHEVRSADTKLLACIVALYQMARSASVRLEVCLSTAILELARVCRLEALARELAAPQTARVNRADSGAPVDGRST